MKAGGAQGGYRLSIVPVEPVGQDGPRFEAVVESDEMPAAHAAGVSKSTHVADIRWLAARGFIDDAWMAAHHQSRWNGARGEVSIATHLLYHDSVRHGEVMFGADATFAALVHALRRHAEESHASAA